MKSRDKEFIQKFGKVWIFLVPQYKYGVNRLVYRLRQTE
jgi:hypothetical protein